MNADDLAVLHALCFTLPPPWSAASFRESLADPKTFLLIPPAPDSRHGFLLGRVVADEAELLTLAIAPRMRLHGLARGLVQDFLTTSAARGAATAFLEAAASNAPARALYTRAGFQEAGLRKRYYRAPDGVTDDAIVMTRAL